MSSFWWGYLAGLGTLPAIAAILFTIGLLTDWTTRDQGFGFLNLGKIDRAKRDASLFALTKSGYEYRRVVGRRYLVYRTKRSVTHARVLAAVDQVVKEDRAKAAHKKGTKTSAAPKEAEAK